MQTKPWKERLERYRHIKSRVKTTLNQIHEWHSTDVKYGSDVIFNYSKGYPKPETIVGPDYARLARLEKRLENDQKEIAEVELFIDGIDDIIDQTVIEKYYVEGLEQPSFQDVARSMGYASEGSPRRIHKNFWKKQSCTKIANQYDYNKK